MIKNIFNKNGSSLYFVYNDNIKIGQFSFDENSRDNSIILEEFEIEEEFQGKGYSKKLINFIEKEFLKKYNSYILNIPIKPYGTERLNKKELKNFYKNNFKNIETKIFFI